MEIIVIDKTVDLPVGASASETCGKVSAGCSAKNHAEQRFLAFLRLQAKDGHRSSKNSAPEDYVWGAPDGTVSEDALLGGNSLYL